MTDQYPIITDFDIPRPLMAGDQAVVDAIQQVEPGTRGDAGSNFITRDPAHRNIGTVGEVIAGRVLNESGEQEIATIEVAPAGIMAVIGVREPGSREASQKQFAPWSKIEGANSAEAQARKLEAAQRIRLANGAAGK